MVNRLPLSPHPLHSHKKDHLTVRDVQSVRYHLNMAGERKFTAQAQAQYTQGTEAEPRQSKDRCKTNLGLCRRKHLSLL